MIFLNSNIINKIKDMGCCSSSRAGSGQVESKSKLAGPVIETKKEETHSHKDHHHDLTARTHSERISANSAYGGGFACNGCGEVATGVSFSCASCEYDLCVHCDHKHRHSKQTHDNHDHALVSTSGHIREANGYHSHNITCDGCKQ